MIRNNDFIVKPVGSKYVITPKADKSDVQSTMARINETGRYIWDLLKDNLTLDEIVSNVAAFYNEEASNIKQGISTYIDSLKSVDLILE